MSLCQVGMLSDQVKGLERGVTASEPTDRLGRPSYDAAAFVLASMALFNLRASLLAGLNFVARDGFDCVFVESCCEFLKAPLNRRIHFEAR